MRPWIRQPPHVSALNAGSALGRKALFAWHGGMKTLHLAARGATKLGTATGTPTTLANLFRPKDRGYAAQFHPSGGSNGLSGINTGVSSGSDVTVFWAGYPSTTTGANLSVLNRGQTNDSLRFFITGNASYIDSSPAQFNCALSPSLSIGRFEQAAFTKNGTSLKRYDWRSGTTATASGGTGTFRTDGAGDYFYINHGATGPNGHVEGLIVAAFDALSDDEVASLFSNPWQLFQPLPRRIYVGPSAAPGGFVPAWARGSNVVINPMGMAA